jgi:hypothetical protein
MIFTYKDVSTLQGRAWHILELRNPRMIEPTLRRLGKALPTIFRDDPVEIFVPVAKRDLDVFELSTQDCIFGRSTNFQSLLRLKSVTGIVGLMTLADSGRASDVLTWADADVQKLIATAEEEFRQRAIGIEPGTFVRILNGQMRDLCGVAEIVDDGKAVVRITLRTKSILLETPIRNLLNLGQVPKEQRVYYYGPLVDQLVKDFPDEGPRLIEEDLHLDDADTSVEVTDEPLPVPETKKHSRQRTVTALVKKLVMLENQHNPIEIAKVIVAALKSGEIKAPKNLFIVYCIIKNLLLKEHFRKVDPSIRNYREVIHKYGNGYKFSAQQIAGLDPELDIPVQTPQVRLDHSFPATTPVQHSKRNRRSSMSLSE